MEIRYTSEEYLNFLEGCYQNPVVLVEIVHLQQRVDKIG